MHLALYCFQCPIRSDVKCGDSGREFSDHVNEGICPLGKFNDPPPPAAPPLAEPVLLGDLVRLLTERTGADRVMKLIAKIRGKECCCAERRVWLNKWDRKLRGRFNRGPSDRCSATR